MSEKLNISKFSNKNATAILLVFFMGSYAINMPHGLGADGWMAYLVGVFAAAPLLLIFARLVRLMPGMGLYDMLTHTLGRQTSIIVSLLYFCYFVTVVASVRVFYGTFLQLTSLTNTPLVVILLALFAVCAYLAKSGVETLGKWSVLLAATVIVGAVLLTLFAIPSMRPENLLPVAASGGREILRGGYRQALLPFGEAVVMLALLGRLERKASPYKIFFLSAAFAALFFVLLFLRDAAILGAGSMDSMRYPFFKAASVIRLGTIEVRVETLASIPFVIAGLTKAAIYLFAAVGAIRRVFGFQDTNAVLVPVAFFSVGLSAILFDNLPALFSFPALHLAIAPLFQIGFPALVWIVAEIKNAKNPVIAKE